MRSRTPPQGVLGIVGHRIRLVQNDQLVAHVEHGAGGGKVHDRAADNANATVIGGVQLQHHRIELRGGVELLRACQDCAGFAGSRRAIEEQMGQLVFRNELVD